MAKCVLDTMVIFCSCVLVFLIWKMPSTCSVCVCVRVITIKIGIQRNIYCHAHKKYQPYDLPLLTNTSYTKKKKKKSVLEKVAL